ncbi:MAG TPA: tyrosine-protein phosphatase [Pyrinomonadaceae bacterium]|nr:tyrosine-protein phosphatase [Pyrinomonadaceae bacterium]
MRKTFINLFGLIITAIWIAPVMMAQDVVKYKELPRFHRVNEKLYRGAQPRAGGLMRLRKLGVRTVVNLRGSNEDIRSEAQQARALGLNYFNVPLGRIGRPADTKVRQALAILNAPENQPVFVHCNYGRDRTGLIIAIYRLANEGWTAEEAQREANRHGMFWWKFGLKNYIRDFYSRTRREALSPAAYERSISPHSRLSEFN